MSDDNIALWSLWSEVKPFALPNTDDILSGYSIAGLRTNFFVQPDLMLDAGLSAQYNPKTILITHGHSDHIANIPFHLYVKNPEAEPIIIYCPQQIVKLLNNYIISMYQLSVGSESFRPFNYKIIGLDTKSDPIIFSHKNKPHQLEIFKCNHSVPCLGYGISEIRRRLKPEHMNQDKSYYIEAKKNGIELNEKYEFKKFIFLGDTDHKVFDLAINPNIFSYPTIIVECSYINEEDLSNATENKHMHLSNLLPVIQAHQDITFILIHFSPRYKKADVEEHFSKLDLPNVKLWLNIK